MIHLKFNSKKLIKKSANNFILKTKFRGKGVIWIPFQKTKFMQCIIWREVCSQNWEKFVIRSSNPILELESEKCFILSPF